MNKVFYSKKKIKNKLILFILILILIYLLYNFNIFQKNNFQNEDFLFFPIIKKESKDKTYYFNVNYKNEKLEKINLLDTIEKNNKNNIKIAPGLEGRFDIQIKTNKNTEVKMQIIKEENKLNNIQFYIEEGNLEEGVKLTVEKEKGIPVRWKWEYEANEKENREDTENGIKTRDYTFYIKLIGKENEK